MDIHRISPKETSGGRQNGSSSQTPSPDPQGHDEIRAAERHTATCCYPYNYRPADYQAIPRLVMHTCATQHNASSPMPEAAPVVAEELKDPGDRY